MALKPLHKTDENNGDKQHKNGLNTDRDMANSSNCKTTVFEIQTREIPTPPPPRGPHMRRMSEL